MKLINRFFQHPTRAKFALNYGWPAWWFSGIKVTHVSDDYRSLQVRMKLRFYNANYVGTQFGGNLFAMTDPFYMLMLLQNLGSHYIVWDKSATINFDSPGRDTVFADFTLSQDKIDEIISQTNDEKPFITPFIINIMDDDKQLVARVKKNIYIKKKSTDKKKRYN